LADYYPPIAEAVNRLEQSTAGMRRSYDRARAAMVAPLRSLTPPLSESDINREQLALEGDQKSRNGEPCAVRIPGLKAVRIPGLKERVTGN
jgi:hypothetical protein